MPSSIWPRACGVLHARPPPATAPGRPPRPDPARRPGWRWRPPCAVRGPAVWPGCRFARRAARRRRLRHGASARARWRRARSCQKSGERAGSGCLARRRASMAMVSLRPLRPLRQVSRLSCAARSARVTRTEAGRLLAHRRASAVGCALEVPVALAVCVGLQQQVDAARFRRGRSPPGAPAAAPGPGRSAVPGCAPCPAASPRAHCPAARLRPPVPGAGKSFRRTGPSTAKSRPVAALDLLHGARHHGAAVDALQQQPHAAGQQQRQQRGDQQQCTTAISIVMGDLLGLRIFTLSLCPRPGYLPCFYARRRTLRAWISL